MAEMAELDRGHLRRMVSRRDTDALAASLRLAVGEPEPERSGALDPSIPHQAETTSSAPEDEPETAEGESDHG